MTKGITTDIVPEPNNNMLNNCVVVAEEPKDELSCLAKSCKCDQRRKIMAGKMEITLPTLFSQFHLATDPLAFASLQEFRSEEI